MRSHIATLFDLLKTGKINPQGFRNLTRSNAAARRFQLLADRKAVGKVVVTMGRLGRERD